MSDNKADISFLFSEGRPIRYKKREIVIRPENTPLGVYYLKKGYIRLFTISESGEELTLIIFKPGDFFPLMWAVNNAHVAQYCETMMEVELQRVPQETFVKFLKNHQDVEFAMLTEVLKRLEGLLERIEYLVFGNAYQKIASILVICSERFGEKKAAETMIKVPLTHKDVANLVGLTRETTSVEIKKLEKKGIIDHEGKLIIIKNIAKLRKEARWGQQPFSI